jgi:hypothetical protein
MKTIGELLLKEEIVGRKLTQKPLSRSPGRADVRDDDGKSSAKKVYVEAIRALF